MNVTFPEQLYSSDALASISLVMFLVALRLLAGRASSGRKSLTPQIVRRWTANFRNLLLLVGVLGLILIWAPQLRTFALSLTAVAIALVVATKELILCLSGSALRTFTRAYSVGDYIELGGTRGEVLDYNLFATRLQEFDGREGSLVSSGREVIIPHSLLFTSPTRVEGVAGYRVRHLFHLTFEPDMNLFAQGDELENVATEAQVRFEAATEQELVRQPSTSEKTTPAVQIRVGTSEIGKYRLTVTTLALASHVEETEKVIAATLGDQVHRHRGWTRPASEQAQTT